MDVLKVSLEALLQRATNAQNENVDTAAVEAFCALVNKEKDGPMIGVKLLAVLMHSKREQEVLQTLHILDYSMQKCGCAFQEEVGKFRFLNEMIKLVSPKYLGNLTPAIVKQKVLQLMYLWMLDYPKQTKIKEAYDMLKKQGVIKDVPLSVCADNSERAHATIFQDEEKSKLLKKLLQSKNPEDLQAANRLIKTMVKEDEKKAELKSKRICELESVQNNTRLLNEMLDSYKSGISSQDELELIKELHESCLRLRPNIVKLASETQHDDILGEVLRMNDELGQVFDKYHHVLIFGNNCPSDKQLSLLDLPYESAKCSEINKKDSKKTNEEVLSDILTAPVNSASDLDECLSILKPTNVVELLTPKCVDINGDKAEYKSSKLKALDDLNALSESLLKENLLQVESHFDKAKISMNQLMKQSNNGLEKQPATNSIDLSFDPLADLTDDLLVDITESPKCKQLESAIIQPENPAKPNAKAEEKPAVKLSDIFVDLKNIKPSSTAPLVLLEERNGVSLTLHFAKDKPHEDIAVVVVTIVSRNELPLKNVLFRAIVPKSCKVKLQQASSNDLPPYNPFLPAAAITQIMLISNPEHVEVSLKFIISYNIEDETMTEMGEVDSLPCFQ